MLATTLRAAALAVALVPTLVAAAPLSFDQALALAVQRSEAARAGHAAAQSATESSRAAGQLPDPTLSAGIDNLPVTGGDSFSTTKDSMTMNRIGLSQEWVSADKRAARTAAAVAMANRETIKSQVAEAEARLQVMLAYLDAWYADAVLDLTAQSEHHLHEEIEAARGRLAAAAGGSADVLELTAAKGMAEDDSEEARQQQATAFVELQRWVGFKPDAVTSVPVFNVPSEQDFAARSPEGAGLQRDVDVARQNAAVAAKERTPNWTWQVSYGQRSGYSDLVSVGVSIPLQIAPAQLATDRPRAPHRRLFGSSALRPSPKIAARSAPNRWTWPHSGKQRTQGLRRCGAAGVHWYRSSPLALVDFRGTAPQRPIVKASRPQRPRIV